ncbi:MAG: hypothetical protein QXX55_01540 [Candidatus Pacearchaeota archaeon]
MIIKSKKKGWIKVIESFISIMLLMAIVLLVINDRYRDNNSYSLFYGIEKRILNEIQMNNSLRQEILNSNPGIEINDPNFPIQTKTKIFSEIPKNINCSALICNPGEICVLSDQKLITLGADKVDIYSESIMLTATQQTFSPKVLKLFCWQRG